MKKIEVILTQCLDDIREGRVSLEDCLNQYPEVRAELELLLKVALSIKAPIDIRPSNTFKVKARAELMNYIHTSQLRKKVKRSPGQLSIRYWWYIAWARATAIVVTVVLVISLAGTGTAYAAQSSLPGDTLYSVKLGIEQLQRIITFDEASEIELELKFADTRLDELEELVSVPVIQTANDEGSNNGVSAMSIINITVAEPEVVSIAKAARITIAVDGYQRNLNMAITKAANVVDGEILVEEVALTILSHLGRLDDIEGMALVDSQEIIADTRSVAINGHIRILQILATVNAVRATEINLLAMQVRLARADAEAVKGNIGGMEDALQEYEKLRRFGEGISNSTEMSGQDTISVDELNARATTEHMESLGSIYGNASQDAKGAVEQAIDVTIETHKQAVQGLQQQGAQGDIPTEPPMPDNIPQGDKGNTQDSESNNHGNNNK